MPLLDDAQVAFDDKAEIVAGLAFLHHYDARLDYAPLGEADDLPDLDVAEFAEEAKGAHAFVDLAR